LLWRLEARQTAACSQLKRETPVTEQKHFFSVTSPETGRTVVAADA